MLLKQQPLEKRNKIKGRGIGSGKGGHTVGFGQKGQGSRGKSKIKVTMEGGNIPIFRKIPTKKGFTSIKENAVEITTRWLNKNTVINDEINTKYLISKGLLKNAQQAAKIIGTDTIDHPITIKGVRTSKGAEKKILEAGGKVLKENA